ncbi:MAG: HpsJ family protein [Timaviella obliquedivisa GSE-PSE-MK23-08B]|jgi:hypothetical protein|nr:HpsJ family protein [Timaviella obliquedivisa GSE-PSE-MK23-08B]
MPAESHSSSNVSHLLKFAGAVLILGIIIDYLTLAFPPNFLNNAWLANLIDQFVGRGVVPLLGLALLFWGMWMDDSINQGSARKLLTSAVLMASGLGVMFLLFTPLYFNSNRLVSAASTQEINKEVETAAQQLERQLTMRQGQVNALLSNSEEAARLDAELQNDQVVAADKAQLQDLKETLDRVKNDPKLLEAEVAKARATGIKQIEERQGQAKLSLQGEMRRARLRITSISFVLAVGYLIVGWNGFSMMKETQTHLPTKKSRSRNPRQKRMGKGNA